MAIGSVSTPYLGTAMIPTVNQAQTQLTQLETETSTGQYANLGLQLGDQSGYELSLRSQDDLLQTLTTANAITTTNISTATAALDSIRSTAESAVQDLTTWSSGDAATTNLAQLGDDSLQSFISQTNSTSGNQYVFGGINSGVAPIAAFSTNPASNSQAAIQQAFQTQFGILSTDPTASTISAADMQTFLDGPFAQQFTGTNWTTNWSSASSTNTSSEIAPGQTIDTSTNANQPGFQDLAEGYAMLATFGGTNLSSSAMQTVVTSAMSLISQGSSSLVGTEGQLGSAQAEITQANSEMSTQMTVLKTQIGNLDNVDANTVATQLNSLTTQIETAYQITAQLQKLSLAQYLPT